MNKKMVCMASLLAATAAVAAPAMAQSAGDTINGTLAFGANGGNGGQYWNPSTIVAPGAFSYADGANIDTATFGVNTLTINDNVLLGANGWEMTFTDATSPFTGLTLLNSTFSPGLTYSFAAGKLTIDWTGTNIVAGPLVANFSTTNGAVPEPATWAMMLVGFGMVGFGLRRRHVSTTVRYA